MHEQKQSLATSHFWMVTDLSSDAYAKCIIRNMVTLVELFEQKLR